MGSGYFLPFVADSMYLASAYNIEICSAVIPSTARNINRPRRLSNLNFLSVETAILDK